MTAIANDIIRKYEGLSETERQEVALEIVRRSMERDFPIVTSHISQAEDDDFFPVLFDDEVTLLRV